jgi:L-alanine-DL-glutamate epimerase-like enolase superfamily enzyme
VVNRYFDIPFSEVLEDSTHGIQTHTHLVTTAITDENGVTGVGYTYTVGNGGRSIWAFIEDDIKPYLIGQDADCIEKIWKSIYDKHYYIGRGGILSFALASVDIAVWDLRGRKLGIPLWKMAGGGEGCVKAYGGGVDLNLSVDDLCKHVQKYFDAGHRAVKIKVGKPNLQDDIDRVEGVRSYLGRDAVFMADANCKWTAAEAVRAAKAFEPYNLLWLEEPCSPDDLYGHTQISRQSSQAIALGENFRTVYEFERMLAYGHCDFPQPDPACIGGVTPFLKVAHIAEAHHLPVSTHGVQELSVSLLSGIANPGWLEIHSYYIERYTKNPVKVVNGVAAAPNTPGSGVEFVFEMMEPHEIKMI